MTHTAEPWEYVRDKDNEEEDGDGYHSIIANDWYIARVWADTKEPATANAQRIVDCVNALAGLCPEAVREMREALVAFKAWMDEWYSIRGEVKITASTSPEDNALIDIYDMACAALKAVEE